MSIGQKPGEEAGEEAIDRNSNQSPAEIVIPITLRPVLPFLEDAQRYLCNTRGVYADANPTVTRSRKRVAVACIDHAFRVSLSHSLSLSTHD
jgi:hypothetical protein